MFLARRSRDLGPVQGFGELPWPRPSVVQTLAAPLSLLDSASASPPAGASGLIKPQLFNEGAAGPRH